MNPEDNKWFLILIVSLLVISAAVCYKGFVEEDRNYQLEVLGYETGVEEGEGS